MEVCFFQCTGDLNGEAEWRQQQVQHDEMYNAQREASNAGAFKSSNIGRRQTFEVRLPKNAPAWEHIKLEHSAVARTAG